MLIKRATCAVLGVVSEKDIEPWRKVASPVARGVVRYDPDYYYLRARAVGCLECDSYNTNHDAFPYGELIDERPGYGYLSYPEKNVFVEHASQNIRNAIGYIGAAYLNAFVMPPKYSGKHWERDLQSEARMEVLAMPGQEDGSVEILMAIDKQREPVIARKVEKNEPIGTSMGANIEYSVCSVCGNVAHNVPQYCSHIANSKGGSVLVPANNMRDNITKGAMRPEWLPAVLHRPADRDEVLKGSSNRMVVATIFEINHGVQFFEQSVVAAPAYPRGMVLEKVASRNTDLDFEPVPLKTLLAIYAELKK